MKKRIKLMKRYAFLMLAVIMAFSCCVPAFATDRWDLEKLASENMKPGVSQDFIKCLTNTDEYIIEFHENSERYLNGEKKVPTYKRCDEMRITFGVGVSRYGEINYDYETPKRDKELYGASYITFKYKLPEKFYTEKFPKNFRMSFDENGNIDFYKNEDGNTDYYDEASSEYVFGDKFGYRIYNRGADRRRILNGGSGLNVYPFKVYYFSEEDIKNGKLENIKNKLLEPEYEYYELKVLRDDEDRFVCIRSNLVERNHLDETTKPRNRPYSHTVHDSESQSIFVIDRIEEIPGLYFRYSIDFSYNNRNYEEYSEPSEPFEMTEIEQKWYNYSLKLSEEFEEMALELTYLKPTDFECGWMLASEEENMASQPEKEPEEEPEEEQKKEELPPVIIDKEAEETKGEDEGVSIPTAVAAGLLGLAAATGAAGAAFGGGKDGGGSDGGEEVKYRLFLSKDFGNRIKKGGKAREIRARVEKTASDGSVYRRDDLSYNISFEGGKYIHVGEKYGVGGSAAVEIWADKDIPEDVKDDYISVIYSGEGGTFTERVHFMLVGESYIIFPEQKKAALMMTIPVIAGDRVKYKVLFVLMDADEEPESITASCDDEGIKVSFEKLDEESLESVSKEAKGYVYNAEFINNTHSIDDKVYEIEKRIFVEITAKWKDETATSGFSISLYPEGLSLKAKNKDGFLIVKAYENGKTGAMDYKLTPTVFRPILAVHEDFEDGSKKTILVELNEDNFKIDKLKAEKDYIGGKDELEYVRNMLDTYKFEIETDSLESTGECSIVPLENLPAYYEGGFCLGKNDIPSDYSTIIPMSCTYNDKEYKTNIYCDFKGEEITEADTWKEEYARLLDIMARYLPYEKQEEAFGSINKAAKKMSSIELRTLSKSIIREAMYRYTMEGRAQMEWASTLEWMTWGAEGVKMLGDVAFSYLAAAYGGAIFEAIISPLKDLTVALAAEIAGHIYFDYPVNIENTDPYKTAFAATENVICSFIDMDASKLADPQNIRKASIAMGLFLFVNAYNNYTTKAGTKGNENYGYIDALLDSCYNLSTKALQNLMSVGVGKMLSSETVKKAIGSKVGKYISGKADELFSDVVLTNKGFSNLPVGVRRGFMKEFPDFKFDVTEYATKDATRYSSEFFTTLSKSETFGKYIDSFFGAGVAYIIPAMTGSVETITHKSNTERKKDDVVITVPFLSANTDGGTNLMIEINLSAGLRNGMTMVSLLWDSIFSWLPTCEEPIEKPKDLPLPPDKISGK